MYEVVSYLYYGDEINLRFWATLKLEFGSPDGDPFFTLQNGYLYRYNAKLHIFDIYDDNGNNIYHRENIQSVADLHIDFTIHKSHQFEIYWDDGGKRKMYLFRLGILKRKKYGPSPINIGNSDMQISNYIEDNYENWKSMQYNLHAIKDSAKLKMSISIARSVHIAPDLHGIGGYNGSNDVDRWKKNFRISAQVYNDKFIVGASIHKKILFKAVALVALHMLLPRWSDTLYIAARPILRPGETVNNRPIYEPWLLEMFKFLLLHPIDNEDDFDLPVLDLSPNWNY